MHILCLGLNHTSSPIDIRERLTFSKEQMRASLARLACGHLSDDISEMVILSTCNRTEIYANSTQADFSELEIFLSQTSNVPQDEFSPHLYHYKDLETVRHLFNVASGLDSLVIGEAQILGQVVNALEFSRGQKMTGPVLNRLFESAIHTGKRARTETEISRNPASVSSLAASLAERVVHPIEAAQIIILGAGEMAELVVEALRKRGVDRILVVNRTLERALAFADLWEAQTTTFENLAAALASADILISSTGAPHTILTADMVTAAMQTRAGRPLVMIDIAVPRDIDPDAAHIPNVKLFDIDNLNEKLEGSLAKRTAEIPRVRAILEEEITEFDHYLQALDMIPIIADIRQQAETIRKGMLEKTMRRLPNLNEAERVRIEAMTLALVKQILHAPINRLRLEASSPHAPEYANVARTLFGIQNGDGCGFSGQTCPIPTSQNRKS